VGLLPRLTHPVSYRCHPSAEGAATRIGAQFIRPRLADTSDY